MSCNSHYVIICIGRPDYLEKTVRRLSKTVGGENVLLLGDSSTFELSCTHGIAHGDVSTFAESSERSVADLAKVFKNDGPNPDEFEFFCFARFFYLENLLRQTFLEDVVHLDADILVFSPPEIAKRSGDIVLPNTRGSYLSKWTLKGISLFNDFIVNCYFKNPPFFRYCDMDALYLFIENSFTEKKVSVSIDDEIGYSDNKRLDLSFRFFLIKSFFNSLRGGEIRYNSAEAERLPIVGRVDFEKLCKVFDDYVEFNGARLNFVHLQGDCKRYFDYFVK